MTPNCPHSDAENSPPNVFCTRCGAEMIRGAVNCNRRLDEPGILLPNYTF